MPIIWSGQPAALADSKWSGIAGSFFKSIGINFHDTPGLIQIHQKLSINSGATVSEFVKVALSLSTGYSIWFSADTGKIWARSSGGTWTLADTATAAAGGVTCLGAMEYDSFVYWATESRLHRVTIAGADDTWAAAAITRNFATFTKTDASFHPMAIQDLTLFIGDANLVASVNSAGTFDDNVLDLNEPHRIRTMIPYEIDLLIGTWIATTVSRAAVIRWDTVSPSWNSYDEVNEVGVNAFIRDDNFVYAQCGLAGRIYFYNGEKLEPYKRIPGTWSSTQYGEVFPYSVGTYKGLPVFGFSNGSGNPTEQGVYTLGSYSRDYPKVLDLSFVNSQDKTATQEIGAIIVENFNLMVAWKDGANYGVDAISTTQKYASASLQTTMLFQDQRDILKTIEGVFALYETLPSGTSITFAYAVNHGAYVSMTSIDDTLKNEVRAELSVPDIGALQIRLTFGVSSNDAPTLEGIGIKLANEET